MGLELRPGAILAGRYELVAELGRGGMAVVYRARDPRLGREVAVKVLASRQASAVGVERFRREAQLVARLDHPAIVPIYDFGRQGEALYFVMPVIEGTTLHQLLRGRELRLGEALEVVAQVAEALDYSHERGVVHRDVKPENVMVGRGIDGELRARVMDFGLALASAADRLTQVGHLPGTLAYLSPEQVLSEEVDGRSDLYSLGTILYECLAGEPPFAGNPHAVLYRIVHERPRPLSARGVDPALEDLVLSLLGKERGARPGRGREVAAALRFHRAGLSPVDDETLGGLPPRPPDQVPFIGRGRELDLLRRRLDAAVAGALQLVLVGGEAGTGKTRLAAELAGLARLRGVRVLRGRFTESDSAFPYQGFGELVQDALREPGASPPDLGDLWSDLLALFPALAELPELRRLGADAPLAEAGPGGDQTRTFELLARLVARLTRGQPALLVLEGLEAASESLAALAYLARRLGSSPILVVATHRPPRPGERAAWSALATAFEGDARFATATLGPLAPDDHRLLLRVLLGEASGEGGPGTDTAEEIYEATDGNPFFTIELVRALVASGSSSSPRGLSGALVSGPLPATVQQVVEARVERLGEDLRRLLATASVLGKSFDLAALEHLWGGDVEAGSERLLQDGLLEEDRRARGDRLAFVSAVVRDVVYAAIPRRRRRALHRQAAEWLERRAADRLDRVYPQLLHHFAAGDVAEKTLEYAVLHARRSLAAASPEEAIRALRTALEVAGEEGGDGGAEGAAARLGEVRLLLATALRRAGHLEAALGEAGRAAELFARSAEPRAGVATLLAVEVAWQGRQVEETRRWVERGLALAVPADDPATRRRLLTYGATVANLAGESGRARRYLDEAERLAAGGDGGAVEPAIGGCLVVALPEPIRSLDPAAFLSVEETEVTANVFEPLLRADSAGNLVPGLAESWSVGEGGASLELTLRGGLVFADGAPLDAAAVKASFERAARHGGDRPPAAVAALAAIELLDARRLRFELREPIPIFAAFLTDSRVAVVRETPFGARVGSGPFAIEHAGPERVVLTRNPACWQAPPLLDRVEVRAGLAASRIAAGLRSGEIDLGRDLDPGELEALLNDPRFRRGLVEATRKSVGFALWNARGALAGRPAARRALAAALRLPDLVWRTLGRIAQPAAGWLPPGILGHDPGRRRPALAPDEAGRLLGEPPRRLRVVAHPLFHGRFRGFADALYAEWRGLGIEVEAAPASLDAYLERWRDPGDADLLLGRWLGDYDDPDGYTFALFHSARGLLASWVAAGEGDALMEAARREADPGRRTALYRRLEGHLADEGLVLPLFHDVDYRLAAPGVEGLRLVATAPWVAYAQMGKRASVAPGEGRGEGRGGTLRVGLPGRFDTLDPALAVTADLAEISPNVFETLTRVAEGAEVVPHLAEEVRLEAGATRLYVRLPDGVGFHDGRRLTARDVRATFERLLTGPFEAAALALLPVRGAQELRERRAGELAGLRILSPLELELELHEPCPLLPAILCHPATAIVPEGSGRFGGNYRQGCAGTGPFRLVRLVPGERVELEANPSYRRAGLPKADRLVFELGLDSPARTAAFRAGRLALASHLRAADAEALWGTSAGYVEAPGFSSYFLVLACRRGPLADRERRLELAAAIRRELDRTPLGRLWIRARTVVPPGLLGHDAQPPAELPDPASPAALAGLALQASIHPAFSGLHAPLWAAVVRAAGATGATLAGRERRPENLEQEVLDPSFDLFASRWFADYPDSDTFFALFHSRRGNLGPLCGDRETDERIDAARREADPARRLRLYRELEETFAREARVVPLFHEQAYRFAAPGLDGVRLRFRWPEVAYEEIALGIPG